MPAFLRSVRASQQGPFRERLPIHRVRSFHLRRLNYSDSSALEMSSRAAGDRSFKFLLVPVGTYKVIISAEGFSNETVENVAVQAGATTNLNHVNLRIGSTEQLVVNGSAAPLLETSDSQVTTDFYTQTVQNLPLNNGSDLGPGNPNVSSAAFASNIFNHPGHRLRATPPATLS